MAGAAAQAIEPDLLVETKFFVPQWKHGLINRQTLIDRLNEGAALKLTLLSAPAGFGKTTAMAEWIASARPDRHSIAWVSLDKTNNDPVLFWTYVITAIGRAKPDAGDLALRMLQNPEPPPTPTILTSLINDLSKVDRDLSIVLDDYHAIECESIHKSLAFFLDHLPPRIHLVIASRSDPPLPLARFRGRSESLELRASDLRFSAEEAAAFLNGLMKLGLSADDVEALERRTEGWIAGLQLAALSMRGRDDKPDFVRAFAGDDRYIVDYLVAEVLERQPENVRRFLLETAMLDQLSGPLCDAVTGKSDSRQRLESLERDNLFVVPLDDKRQWYRYHQLFADVLQAHAMEDDPDQIRIRHRRASEWFTGNGETGRAVRHALAAGDDSYAARLIELAWRPMDRSRQLGRWLEWAGALPEEEIRVRPVLSVALAWAMLETGQLEEGIKRLDAAEALLSRDVDSPHVPDEAVVDDEAEYRSLPASIAAARAFHAQAVGDVPATIEHARRALDLLPEDDPYRRGSPAALLALSSWAAGDLDSADRALADALEGCKIAGDTRFVVTAAYVLAAIRIERGRLLAARDVCQEALEFAERDDTLDPRGTADLHTALADLHGEWNDLDAAATHLQRSKELGEGAGMAHWRHRWCVTRARLEEERGNLPQALEFLDEAERHYLRGPVPDVRPISALKARLSIAIGNIADAQRWANDRGVSADDDPGYLTEFEHLVLARLLIEQYRRDSGSKSIEDARRLVANFLARRQKDRIGGASFPILILQALAFQAADELSRALEPLEHAMSLARTREIRAHVHG
ncbi:MAG: hypothetical protein R3A46_14425 [Thermomicrobiales bacterium]